MKKLWRELAWLWHALFDGTAACRCEHSAEYKRALADAVQHGVRCDDVTGLRREYPLD